MSLRKIDSDYLFDYIGKRKVSAIFFVTDTYLAPLNLKSILHDPRVLVFNVDRESMDVLQIAKIPQMRLYLNGNEKVSLISDHIFTWEAQYAQLGDTDAKPIRTKSSQW